MGGKDLLKFLGKRSPEAFWRDKARRSRGTGLIRPARSEIKQKKKPPRLLIVKTSDFCLGRRMDLEDQAQIMGGLQRSRSNNELAALNAQLKQIREEEARAPKCPYCIGPITEGAVKCRHCASDIEWFVFEGLRNPCKVGEGDQIVADLRAEKGRLQAEQDEQLRRAIEECPSCKKCGTLNAAESIEAAKSFSEGGVCLSCQKKAAKVFLGVLIVVILFLGILISVN